MMQHQTKTPTAQRQHSQTEQIGSQVLDKIFEVDQKHVRFNELEYYVNFNSIRITLQKLTSDHREALGENAPKFLFRAEDGNGFKNWAIDENGVSTPTTAKLNNCHSANSHDMSHLKVTKLIEYINEQLSIK